jgi:3-dehydroquinate synthase
MDSIQQKITVSFQFPVHFTAGVFDRPNTVLRDVIAAAGAHAPARILFVVDAGVADAHPHLLGAIEAYCAAHRDVLELAGPVVIVPGGEQIKNDVRHLERIQRAIYDARLCRHSYVAAVGGGALLDVAGYAAAIAHRGVRLVRIPTTVLAQDDSGVGVKNGINAFGQKNYLGTFAPPFAVLNDVDFLSTLPDREWRGGIAEAVKAALIKDRAFFTLIEERAAALAARDLTAMKEIVRRSAVLHLQHIARGGDPFELGSSRPLDFGHWAAHKLERLTDHRLGHGEAVAIGLALDTTYSHLAGFLAEAEWRRITGLLLALGLSIYAPELQSTGAREASPSLLNGLDEFREHLGGRLTILLLRSIGQPFEVHEIRNDIMMRSIEILRELDRAGRPAEDRHEHRHPADAKRTRR